MKFLIKLIKPFIKNFIIKKIEEEDFQKEMVKKINEKIDIPNVDEKEEEKFVNSIYDALQEILVDVVDDI